MLQIRNNSDGTWINCLGTTDEEVLAMREAAHSLLRFGPVVSIGASTYRLKERRYRASNQDGTSEYYSTDDPQVNEGIELLLDDDEVASICIALKNGNWETWSLD